MIIFHWNVLGLPNVKRALNWPVLGHISTLPTNGCHSQRYAKSDHGEIFKAL